jgi:hypothetical protein
VYAPVLAARMVLGKVARPVLLLGAGAAAARGALGLLQLRRAGPAQLLRRLVCGAGAELDTLVKIAVNAARSESFRRAFVQ